MVSDDFLKALIQQESPLTKLSAMSINILVMLLFTLKECIQLIFPLFEIEDECDILGIVWSKTINEFIINFFMISISK